MDIDKVKTTTGKTRYRIRWREGARQRQKTVEFKWQADEAATDIANRLRAGLPTIDSKITVDELADRWLKEHVETPACKEHTAIFYKKHLKLRIRPELGHLPAALVDRQRIRSLIAAIYAQIEASKKAETAAAKRTTDGARTVNGTLDTLRALYNFGIHDLELLHRNPVEKTKRGKGGRPKEQRRKPRPVPLEHMWAVSRSPQRHRDQVMELVLGLAGARISEACALRKQDIDFDAGVIHYRWSRSPSGKKIPLKGSQAKDVTLMPALAEAIRGWLDAPDWERIPKTDVLFPDRNGNMQDPDNWRTRVFYPAVKAAQIDDKPLGLATGKEGITPHDFRHSFGSLIIDLGGTALEVKDEMRHESITTTYDIYGHRLDHSRGKLREAFSERLASVVSG